ncbi:hypothetical protein GCM10010278_17060 [Streptomyces melanogenes]|nr:hypothetical protein GCM10010278_17060 [Streptomyces melanogenes]
MAELSSPAAANYLRGAGNCATSWGRPADKDRAYKGRDQPTTGPRTNTGPSWGTCVPPG